MTNHFAILAAAAAMIVPGAAAAVPPVQEGVTVDPGAFSETPRTLRKKGVTVSAAQLSPIRVGSDKDSIYTLIGTPHFGEGITRRWNYVIFIAQPDNPPLRCRLRIDFGAPRDGYNVVVKALTWSSDACLRAASA